MVLLNCQSPPKYCYFLKNRWVYYPNEKPRKQYSLKNGRLFLRSDATCLDVYASLDALLDDPKETVFYLLKTYLGSHYVSKLSKSTQKGYSYYFNTIIRMEMKNGKNFGDMPLNKVTTGVLTKYLDKRQEQGVTTGANREIELLSASYNYFIRRDMASYNPCSAVKHIKEQSRTKYISDEEYNFLLEYSKGTSLYFACEITYLCRARGIEAWGLTLDDIRDDKGVFIYRSKGSLPEWTMWTSRLRKLIDDALLLRSKTLSKKNIVGTNGFLLLTNDGQPYSKNARDSAWQRVYKKMYNDGKVSMKKSERFSFHDIKAKGVSDHELNESGHKSDSAKAVYLRKVKEVKSTR